MSANHRRTAVRLLPVDGPARINPQPNFAGGREMSLSTGAYEEHRTKADGEECDRAKQIILHILSRAGGSLGKRMLFKAFWIAHLFYAKKAAGYLSGWKIIRLPHGPGINKGDDLILQLKNSGDIALEHEPRGPYLEIICKLVNHANRKDLSDAAIEAIDSAVGVIRSHDSVAQISEWSHDASRSWNTTPNGSELDIYSDLIPDDVYYERKQKLEQLNDVWIHSNFVTA
jgi:hypothetical protein